MQAAKELPDCPVETTLMLIGDKWKVLILLDLMPGTKRLGEMKRSIVRVSQNVLDAMWIWGEGYQAKSKGSEAQ